MNHVPQESVVFQISTTATSRAKMPIVVAKQMRISHGSPTDKADGAHASKHVLQSLHRVISGPDVDLRHPMIMVVSTGFGRTGC